MTLPRSKSEECFMVASRRSEPDRSKQQTRLRTVSAGSELPMMTFTKDVFDSTQFTRSMRRSSEGELTKAIKGHFSRMVPNKRPTMSIACCTGEGDDLCSFANWNGNASTFSFDGTDDWAKWQIESSSTSSHTSHTRTTQRSSISPHMQKISENDAQLFPSLTPDLDSLGPREKRGSINADDGHAFNSAHYSVDNIPICTAPPEKRTESSRAKSHYPTNRGKAKDSSKRSSSKPGCRKISPSKKMNKIRDIPGLQKNQRPDEVSVDDLGSKTGMIITVDPTDESSTGYDLGPHNLHIKKRTKSPKKSRVAKKHADTAHAYRSPKNNERQNRTKSPPRKSIVRSSSVQVGGKRESRPPVGRRSSTSELPSRRHSAMQTGFELDNVGFPNGISSRSSSNTRGRSMQRQVEPRKSRRSASLEMQRISKSELLAIRRSVELADRGVDRFDLQANSTGESSAASQDKSEKKLYPKKNRSRSASIQIPCNSGSALSSTCACREMVNAVDDVGFPMFVAEETSGDSRGRSVQRRSPSKGHSRSASLEMRSTKQSRQQGPRRASFAVSPTRTSMKMVKTIGDDDFFDFTVDQKAKKMVVSQYNPYTDETDFVVDEHFASPTKLKHRALNKASGRIRSSPTKRRTRSYDKVAFGEGE